LSDNQAIISVVLPIHMLKPFLCATSAIALSAGSAMANGFYLNPEYNHGWSGSDSLGGVLDAHVGYEQDAFYLQLGPSIKMLDGDDAEVGFSGKTGFSAPVVAEKLDFYGEVSVAKFEDTDAAFGAKAGMKYKF
jgi:hypothetical protein